MRPARRKKRKSCVTGPAIPVQKNQRERLGEKMEPPRERGLEPGFLFYPGKRGGPEGRRIRGEQPQGGTDKDRNGDELARSIEYLRESLDQIAAGREGGKREEPSSQADRKGGASESQKGAEAGGPETAGRYFAGVSHIRGVHGAEIRREDWRSLPDIRPCGVPSGT